MRKVFSSIEISETVLVRDALLHKGFDVTLRSEHAGQSAVPGFRPPAEVWLRNDADYDKARQVVVETVATLDSKAAGTPWTCANCGESNPQSFEICWNCGRERGGPSGA